MLKSRKGTSLPTLILWAVLVMNIGAVGREIPAAPLPQPTGRTWLFLEPEQFSPDELATRLEEASAQLTPRARARRAKNLGWPPVRQCDLPPSRERIEAIESTGCCVIRTLRYLNAVVVTGSEDAIATLRDLSFVQSTRPVMAFAMDMATDELRAPTQNRTTDLADYGEALTQSLLVNIPAAHDEGYHGEAMLIGVQDTGFETRLHRAYRSIDVVATYDFVNDNQNVYDEEDVGSALHGTRVLSIIAGLDSGNYIGVAPFAQFVLTKTENTTSETPVEEDLWVAGLWFHDSLGVDVLSSSLSYRDWHEYEDYDGATAVTSRAADSAFAAGIVLVNSIGNTGLAGYPESKLGAPADARGVISVGGVSADSTRWRSSSQGPTYDGRIKPDVVAQSSLVYTISTADNSSYSGRSGTSFSTPIVAGVAALVVQANSDLTSAQVQDVLRRTSSNAESPDTLIGYGIVNAHAAVTLAREMSVSKSQPPDRHQLFLLYPNPTNGKALVVRYGFDDKPLILRGIDGRVLHDGIGTGVLDLSRYPAGSYWVGSKSAGWRRLVLLK